MAISLGGVALHRSLIWSEPFGHSNHSYSRRITLLGKVVIQYSPSPKRLISLTTISTTGGSQGIFTKDQLDQLAVFEQAMTQIVFIYESETLNVLIESGGINVEPLVARPSPASTDYYTGNISLIEI